MCATRQRGQCHTQCMYDKLEQMKKKNVTSLQHCLNESKLQHEGVAPILTVRTLQRVSPSDLTAPSFRRLKAVHSCQALQRTTREDILETVQNISKQVFPVSLVFTGGSRPSPLRSNLRIVDLSTHLICLVLRPCATLINRDDLDLLLRFRGAAQRDVEKAHPRPFPHHDGRRGFAFCRRRGGHHCCRRLHKGEGETEAQGDRSHRARNQVIARRQ